MLNVDLDPRGGFGQRQGVATVGSGLSNPPKNIWAFSNGTGTSQVLVQDNSLCKYTAGGAFTDCSIPVATTNGVMRSASFRDPTAAVGAQITSLYIQRNAEQAPVRWNGTTATGLVAPAYNEPYSTPNQGNMPWAKCIAAHSGYMWVANTKEGATPTPTDAYKNRVRFSHPNQPEDWRALDYIDVEIGVEGDEITALVPFLDRLLVFKNNSVHAIYGYDPSTFQVETLSRNVGAVSQEAVCLSSGVLYFFSWPEGVFSFDGKQVTWIFDRLRPIIDDGFIAAPDIAKIALGWINKRLWVAVPYSSTTNSRVFVYDPTLTGEGRNAPPGGWTMYDLQVGPMVQWEPVGAAHQYFACWARPATAQVLKLHQNAAVDNFGAGNVNITSSFTTRWVDAEVAAVKKRWRKPEFVLDGDETLVLTCQSYKDYDPGVVHKTFTIATTAIGAIPVWDTATYAVDPLGPPNYPAESSGGTQEIHSGPGMGSGRSIQLTVGGPVPSLAWSVNAITFKYIAKRVR
jgi:hypothetical protein